MRCAFVRCILFLLIYCAFYVVFTGISCHESVPNSPLSLLSYHFPCSFLCLMGRSSDFDLSHLHTEPSQRHSSPSRSLSPHKTRHTLSASAVSSTPGTMIHWDCTPGTCIRVFCELRCCVVLCVWFVCLQDDCCVYICVCTVCVYVSICTERSSLRWDSM